MNCVECSGSGRVLCAYCRGERGRRDCFLCDGTGYSDCDDCNGSGNGPNDDD